MADEPLWNIEVQRSAQSIQQHLVVEHGLNALEVDQYTDDQCWECHNRQHESALGKDWWNAAQVF